MKSIKLLFFLLCANISFAQNIYDHEYPFSTNETHLTIWNGNDYVPFFVKGTNLGVSVPGTFPGELAAGRHQYATWFEQIKHAGFNCIRLYTLHYPRFYEVLDSFNRANPNNPLLFIQGAWLNEDLPGYDHDLYFLTDTFKLEVEENIDCVHGNKLIPVRQGKAFGDYTTDASNWCLAYIIGREVYPEEVLTTNERNGGVTSFFGDYFSIAEASASEVWFTQMLEHLVSYEYQNYNTQRPVSISSWPTLDPLTHPEEENRYEDTASVDLSKVSAIHAPAGFFVSYHAYPYYPDFVSLQSDYRTYADDLGPNSYKGYLTDLKSHYPEFPLIIAEYGVPSSWGIAHFATSGMNHGGFDERGQGENNLRILNTIESTNCGGGIHFAWIDEWFKRTWITDPIDYIPEDRVLWHNIAAAEQNFGLIKFEKNSNLQTIKQFDAAAAITNIKADANYDFFEMEVGLNNPLDNPDELWIALDTYADELGESQLVNGVSIPFRAEFVLHITNHAADLYVTQAYDIFGIWHHTSGEEQLYRSIPTDGAPWYIVRWKNNSGDSDVQYIGGLQVNYSFQNPSSKDGVTIYEDKLKIRLPYSLLNFVAPNRLEVLHDYRSTPETEDTVSTGIQMGVYYNGQWFASDTRFVWDSWQSIDEASMHESFKTSYHVMADRLTQFNTPAVAVCDSFVFEDEIYPVYVDSLNGILINDFDLDGNLLIPLISISPENGQVILNNDGSFVYQPNVGFTGFDSFYYTLYDGYSLSEPNEVVLNNISSSTFVEEPLADLGEMIKIYPNPTSSSFTIETKIVFDEIKLFNTSGQLIKIFPYGQQHYEQDISAYNAGTFFLVAKYKNQYLSKKIIKLN
jgi:hypothetical protein